MFEPYGDFLNYRVKFLFLALIFKFLSHTTSQHLSNSLKILGLYGKYQNIKEDTPHRLQCLMVKATHICMYYHIYKGINTHRAILLRK